MSIFSRKNKNTKPYIAANNTQQAEPIQNEEIAENKFQNRAILVLFVVGLASFVFSIWRIGHMMHVEPVAVDANTNSSQLSSLLENTTDNPATLEDLKNKDTDQDGLSDYDELYVYKTSPYIADSDSDGINDKAEIDQGTDPNCPKGKDCGRTTNTNTNGNTNSTDGTTNTNTSDQTNVDLENMTADQLRTLLRNAGASDTDLQKIDDATLLETYRQALPEITNTNANTNGVVNTNTSTSTTNTNSSSSATNSQSVTYEQLQNLSAADIRQLLISSGVDAATLDGVDDATLKSVFLDALNQEVNGTNTNTNQ